MCVCMSLRTHLNAESLAGVGVGHLHVGHTAPHAGVATHGHAEDVVNKAVACAGTGAGAGAGGSACLEAAEVKKVTAAA